MSRVVNSCLRPIVNSHTAFNLIRLNEYMEERGAIMSRIELRDDPNEWNVIFYLDTRFYCTVRIVVSLSVSQHVIQKIRLAQIVREESIRPVDVQVTTTNVSNFLNERLELRSRNEIVDDVDLNLESLDDVIDEEEMSIYTTFYEVPDVRMKVLDYKLWTAYVHSNRRYRHVITIHAYHLFRILSAWSHLSLMFTFRSRELAHASM
jgi:hypothetical protein